MFSEIDYLEHVRFIKILRRFKNLLNFKEFQRIFVLSGMSHNFQVGAWEIKTSFQLLKQELCVCVSVFITVQLFDLS